MKVSVLETGKLPENLENKFGDYPKMFSDLFDQLNVTHEIKSFDLINSYAVLLIDQERNLVEVGLNL